MPFSTLFNFQIRECYKPTQHNDNTILIHWMFAEIPFDVFTEFEFSVEMEWNEFRFFFVLLSIK